MVETERNKSCIKGKRIHKSLTLCLWEGNKNKGKTNRGISSPLQKAEIRISYLNTLPSKKIKSVQSVISF